MGMVAHEENIFVFSYFDFFYGYVFFSCWSTFALRQSNQGQELVVFLLALGSLCLGAIIDEEHLAQIFDAGSQVRYYQPHVGCLLIHVHAPALVPELEQLRIVLGGNGHVDEIGRHPLLPNYLAVLVPLNVHIVVANPVQVKVTGGVDIVPLEVNRVVVRAEEWSPAQRNPLTPVEVGHLDLHHGILLGQAIGDEEAIAGAEVANFIGCEWGHKLCPIRQVHPCQLLLVRSLESLNRLLVEQLLIDGLVHKEHVIEHALVLRNGLQHGDFDGLGQAGKDLVWQERVDVHDDIKIGKGKVFRESLVGDKCVCIAPLEAHDHILAHCWAREAVHRQLLYQ